MVALFSELVLENSHRPIFRVWSKLDPIAHSVILSELGCFDQEKRARRDECDRAAIAELKKHMRKMRKFLEQQVAHESELERQLHIFDPDCRFIIVRGREAIKTILEAELDEMNYIALTMNQFRKPRDKWAAGGMVLAQEFVIRRAAFLGLPGRVRLTPSVIADIYSLLGKTRQTSDYSDTAENIRKSIAHFRKQPENAHLFENIERYVRDWTVLAKTENRSGDLTPQK